MNFTIGIQDSLVIDGVGITLIGVTSHISAVTHERYYRAVVNVRSAYGKQAIHHLRAEGRVRSLYPKLETAVAVSRLTPGLR